MKQSDSDDSDLRIHHLKEWAGEHLPASLEQPGGEARGGVPGYEPLLPFCATYWRDLTVRP